MTPNARLPELACYNQLSIAAVCLWLRENINYFI